MKCKNPAQICSTKLLYKIESGKSVNNDCYYIRLCQRLGFKFNLNNNLIIKMELLQNQMDNVIRNHNEDDLKSLEKKITLLLRKYSNTIYIHELLSLDLDLINNILYNKNPSNENIEIYFYLKDFSCKREQSLIYLLLISSNDIKGNQWIQIDELSSLIDDPIFIKYKMISKGRELQLDEFLFYLKNLLKNEKKYNFYQQYLIYNYCGRTYLNMGNYLKCRNVLLQCLQLVEKGKLGMAIKAQTKSQLGLVSFFKKDYKNSIIHFMNAKKYNNYSLGQNILLLCHSLEQTNNIETIKDFIKPEIIHNCTNYYEKVFLTYYKIKYSCTDLKKETIKELEDYINEKIKPIITNQGSIYVKVLVNELINLITISNDYKALYTFLNDIHTK